MTGQRQDWEGKSRYEAEMMVLPISNFQNSRKHCQSCALGIAHPGNSDVPWMSIPGLWMSWEPLCAEVPSQAVLGSRLPSAGSAHRAVRFTEQNHSGSSHILAPSSLLYPKDFCCSCCAPKCTAHDGVPKWGKNGRKYAGMLQTVNHTQIPRGLDTDSIQSPMLRLD